MDITCGIEQLKSIIAHQISKAREEAIPTQEELAARKEAEKQAKKKKPPIQGITQEELAARMGVDRNLIKHWEIGDREIRASGLKAVAEALNVSVDWLLDPSKSPSRNEDIASMSEYTGLYDTIITRLHTSPNSFIVFLNKYLDSLLSRDDEYDDPTLAQLLAEKIDRAARARYMVATSKHRLSEQEAQAYNDMRWAVYTGKTSYDDEKDTHRAQAGEIVLSPIEAASFFTSEATYLANPEYVIENVVGLLADGMIEGNENEDT